MRVPTSLFSKVGDWQPQLEKWKRCVQVLIVFGLIISLLLVYTPILASQESKIDNLLSQPVLVQPADDAMDVTKPVTLEVTVSNSDSGLMDVSFYGRPAHDGNDGDFLLVFIPDPQNESVIAVDMFQSQTNWIVNNKTSENIAMVTTTGDMVNEATSLTQYRNADSAIDILDNGGVWYTVGPGNHDINYGNTYFDEYFGTQRYSSYLVSNGYWFGGAYDDFNSYSLFSAGEMDFILINLQHSPSQAVLDWADALLSTYSARRAIVAEHDILDIDNSWVNSSAYYALRDHDNLFLMLCGHMHSGEDGAAYVAGKGTGVAGQTIHIVMADYQDMNWGNGYLRLFRFSPLNDMIYMSTYSPYSGDSITKYPDQMNLPYGMISGPPFELLGTVQDVPSDGTASFTWDGLDYGTAYEWYAVANDGTTQTNSPTWSFTTELSPVNNAPVDISLSEITVAENSPVSTVVGIFSTLDPDKGNSFTYSLVSGIGDNDNSSFNVNENNLRTSEAFDFETRSTYSIRVRTTDQGGLFFEKQLIITVTDVYEIVVPTIEALSPPLVMAGSEDITLTITGTDFREGAQVLWNGTSRPTNYIDATRISTTISAAEMEKVASVSITAKNFDSEASSPTEFIIHTFADTVPGTWYWRWVEGFYAQGITAGCELNPFNYCPDRPVTRAEMAVFILRAMNGLATPVPSTTGMFADVPALGLEWSTPWIEQLYLEGITAGCATEPLRYCPEREVTRAEMAVFILRAMHGKDYTPPEATGIFTDLPVEGNEWSQPWVEQLYREGITSGCMAEPLQYCPEQSITRAEMATFIDRAFGYPQLP